jgi:hypothetical protein
VLIKRIDDVNGVGRALTDPKSEWVCISGVRTHPRTNRRHCGSLCAPGHGQDHRRWARHEGHRCALPLHEQRRPLDIEDERGETIRGKDTMHELANDWRFGRTLIDDVGGRREAFNIMLSMPRGTDPLTVQHAAREFAKIELADHKDVMVLHDHQANPHVHISVRAESKHGKRLNPRKADLHRWRETFAEKLRDRGVESEATRQATRGRNRNYVPLWRVKARDDGPLRTDRPRVKSSPRARATRAEAVGAWTEVGRSLAKSSEKADRELARSIATFIQAMSATTPSDLPTRAPTMEPVSKPIDIDPRR